MNFDEIIDRRGTHSDKWDMMEAKYGVSPEDGIAMWVADMDFRPPACVSAALRAMTDHGIYGYYGDDAGLLDAKITNQYFSPPQTFEAKMAIIQVRTLFRHIAIM